MGTARQDAARAAHTDFRQLLPAFDKYLYFPDHQHLDRLSLYARAKGTLRRAYRPQDYLRRRTPRVKRLLNDFGQTFSEDTLSVASHVLGRQYIGGSFLEHGVYRGHRGTTILLRTNRFAEGYSDAYAGSGESAALTLIHEIHTVPKGSIVLLDEPETSLHPSAQQRVCEFIVYSALRRDLQFVIATHSQYFGEGLPKDAIRLLRERDDGSIEIVSGLTNREALHDVATLPRERTILVEDERAKSIVVAALKRDPGNLEHAYDVRVRHGGASVIHQDVAAHGAARSRHILIVFDGDQRPKDAIPKDGDLPRGRDELQKLIRSLTRGNDSSGPSIPFATDEDCVEYVRFIRENVFYLPGETPESSVWDHANVSKFMNTFGVAQSIDEIESTTDPKARLRILSQAVPGMTEDAVFASLLAYRLSADPSFVADLVAWIRKHLDAPVPHKRGA